MLTLQALVWWQACLVAFVCHGLGTLDLDVHTLISFSYVTDVSKLIAVYLREIKVHRLRKEENLDFCRLFTCTYVLRLVKCGELRSWSCRLNGGYEE